MVVPAVFPVAVKFCAMDGPVPDVAPVEPVCAAVHEKEVPGKLLVSAMAIAFPEQMLWLVGVAVTTGFGFTEMTIFMGFPEHPFAVGIAV